MEFKHKPVMLGECIEGLNIRKNEIYVDGTIGGAGHSKEIAKKLEDTGKIIAIDRDEEALKAAKENLKEFMSSYQLDERNRGFSYLGENNLDMRMDKTQSLTAEKVINEYTEKQLADIIFQYGEERFAKKIAKNICEFRKEKHIRTTKELVGIIEKSIPLSKQNDGHPAKRTFQAIRIEVNNEIKPLYNTIIDCIDCLKPNGRLCVITFHSLEDRAVKNAMIDSNGKCTCPPDLPYCVCGAKSKGKMITKKPILPTDNEIQENSRSKSAKLRIFEKK